MVRIALALSFFAATMPPIAVTDQDSNTLRAEQ